MRILGPDAEVFKYPDPVAPAQRLRSLVGSRVGLIDNGFGAIKTIHLHLLRRMTELGAEQGSVASKRYWRPLDPDALDSLAIGADGVLTGLCVTPPSTYATITDCVGLESRGVPTVCFVARPYVSLFEGALRATGAPDLPRVIVPYPVEGSVEKALLSLADRAFDFVSDALTQTSRQRALRVDWD